MGEVRGYSLHVYCDDRRALYRYPDGCYEMDEFGGKGLREARKNAREAGWLVTRGPLHSDLTMRPRWTCPACLRARTPPTTSQPEPSGGQPDDQG